MIYKGIEIPDSMRDKVIDRIVEDNFDEFMAILCDAYMHRRY